MASPISSLNDPITQHYLAVLESLRRRIKTTDAPLLTVQLGSGWREILDDSALEISEKISFSEIGIPAPDPTIGHAGEFIFATLQAQPILIVNGRLHRYDLAPLEKHLSLLPVWLALQLGCKQFILTCAAGGIHPRYRVGELVPLRDHILFAFDAFDGIPRNLFSPLKFNGMTGIYSTRVRRTFFEHFPQNEPGVYVQLNGPSFETPATIQMLKVLGGDLVGMSTAHEASALHAAGVEVFAVACVTNPAAAEGAPAPTHEEVNEAMAMARETLHESFRAFLIACSGEGTT